MKTGIKVIFTVTLAIFASFVHADIKIADTSLTGVQIGAPLSEVKDALDLSHRMALYDLDGKKISWAFACPIVKPGILVPEGATKVRAVAIVAKSNVGWRVVSMRASFKASPEDEAKIEILAKDHWDEHVRFLSASPSSPWTTIVVSDGSQEASELAFAVADFFTRLFEKIR